MQSWCRTWPPNGSNLIRVKQKLHRKPREACKSSWSQIGSPKSFTLTILWTGKSCEDSSWNHCTSTRHTSETNGIAERAVRRIKKAPLPYCCDQIWMKNGERVPLNVTAICETFKILSDVKTPYERRFGKPFHGFVIPFGAMVEYHPISARDQSRLHQLGAKVLPEKCLGKIKATICHKHRRGLHVDVNTMPNFIDVHKPVHQGHQRLT